MNRRGFLSMLGGAGAAALAAGDLWKPERTIFLPPRGGWLLASRQLKRDIEQTLAYTHIAYSRYEIRDDLLHAIYSVDPFKTPLFNMKPRG